MNLTETPEWCSQFIFCYKNIETSKTIDIIFLVGTSCLLMIGMYLLDRHTSKLAKKSKKMKNKFYGKENKI